MYVRWVRWHKTSRFDLSSVFQYCPIRFLVIHLQSSPILSQIENPKPINNQFEAFWRKSWLQVVQILWILVTVLFIPVVGARIQSVGVTNHVFFAQYQNWGQTEDENYGGCRDWKVIDWLYVNFMTGGCCLLHCLFFLFHSMIMLKLGVVISIGFQKENQKHKLKLRQKHKIRSRGLFVECVLVRVWQRVWR